MFLFATVTIRPALPLGVILPLWAAAVAWAWFGLARSGLTPRRRRLLAGVRVAAMTVLALLLLLPERRHTAQARELPLLAVAVDLSASMRDRPAGIPPATPTRADRALAFMAGSEARALANRFRLAWYEVGATAAEAAAPPTRPENFAAADSRLSPALNQIAARMQGQNSAGILLLSDGLDLSGEALAAAARTVPIHVLELEPRRPEAAPVPECWIADAAYPRRAVVNWQTALDLLIRRQPASQAGEPAILRLLDGETELDRQTVTWAEGENARLVNVSFTPAKVGPTLLRAVLEPAPGRDTQPANNRRELLIEVLDPENRVLYLEGAPRWEFKFLKRALVADKNVLLSAFVSAGNGAFLRFDEESRGPRGGAERGLPAFTRETLARFKVIILGDLPPDALTPADQQALAGFVENGGGLLLVPGPRSLEPGTPFTGALAEALPARPASGARFREGRLAMDVTAAGLTHPALRGLNPALPLPPLLSLCAPVTLHPATTVLLASAEGAPLLLSRPYGQGKCALLLSDSLWHWRTGEGVTDGGRRYDSFYAQLVNWLGPTADAQGKNDWLRLRLSASELDPRQPLTIGAQLDEATATGQPPTLTCRIAAADGTGSPLLLPLAPGSLGPELGLASPVPGLLAETRLTTPGLYNVTVATADNRLRATAQLLVREPVQELTGAPADFTRLEKWCQESGGQLFSWDDRGQLPARIPGDAREFTSIVETALWPNPFGLLALVALFITEWVCRRRCHLS